VVGNAPGEFEPKHWLKVVDHNGIIFLSEEIKNKINELIAEKPDEETYKVDIKSSTYIVQNSNSQERPGAGRYVEFDGYVIMV
jgi:hypothetical protein